jgi:hypothetical protein
MSDTTRNWILAAALVAASGSWAYAADPDGDGLESALEGQLGTNPMNDDTDGDTILDRVELFEWGTSPVQADSDGDGIADNLDSEPLDNGDPPATARPTSRVGSRASPPRARASRRRTEWASTSTTGCSSTPSRSGRPGARASTSG